MEEYTLKNTIQFNRTSDIIAAKIGQVEKDIVMKDFLNYILNEDKGIRGEGYNYANALRVFADITLNNENNYVLLFERYSLSRSQKEKTLIRRGQSAQEEYTKRLKSRPQPEDKVSIFKTSYWESIGYSNEEAIEKVSEIQRKNAIKKHEKSTPEDYKKANPFSLEYYLSIGLNYIEATIEREDFLNKSSCLKESFYISRYGVKEGKKKFRDRYSKRTETMIERYGKYVISSGNKSKSSNNFFDKLTNELANIGIKPDRIIGGNITEKEFARTDFEMKRTYFYDYVLLDLKIIIEYNGLFWHARNEDEWRSTFTTFDESKQYDKRKKTFIEEDGYEVLYVWDDEDETKKIKELKEYVETRLHTRRRFY